MTLTTCCICAEMHYPDEVCRPPEQRLSQSQKMDLAKLTEALLETARGFARDGVDLKVAEFAAMDLATEIPDIFERERVQ